VRLLDRLDRDLGERRSDRDLRLRRHADAARPTPEARSWRRSVRATAGTAAGSERAGWRSCPAAASRSPVARGAERCRLRRLPTGSRSPPSPPLPPPARPSLGHRAGRATTHNPPGLAGAPRGAARVQGTLADLHYRPCAERCGRGAIAASVLRRRRDLTGDPGPPESSISWPRVGWNKGQAGAGW